MFQYNPDLCKINCDLEEIYSLLNSDKKPNFLDIERHLSIVSDFIDDRLQAPSLPYYERTVLLTQKDELASLAGRCNDKARELRLAQVGNYEEMRSFKRYYNLTAEEQIQITYSKIVPLYSENSVEILEFSDLTDLCYEIAVYLYQKNYRKCQEKWAMLSERDRLHLTRHISLCNGSLEDSQNHLGAIQALIGYAEQHNRDIISYPPLEEAIEVVQDLLEIYESKQYGSEE